MPTLSHDPPPRQPATDARVALCALVTGGSTCRCADDLAELSDAVVIGRIRSMIAGCVQAEPAARNGFRAGLDVVVEATGSRTPVFVEALFAAAFTLLVPDRATPTADRLNRFDALLGEYLKLAEESADGLMAGEASVLQAGREQLLLGHDGVAEMAEAVALLAEDSVLEPPANGLVVDRAGNRLRALGGLARLASRYGAYELAEEIHQQVGAATDHDEVRTHDRIRLNLAWALELERSGHDAEATSRLAAAARHAEQATATGSPPGPFLMRNIGIRVAARALHRPAARHLPALRDAPRTAGNVIDQPFLTIARARCSHTDHDRSGATAELREALATLPDQIPTTLRAALHRELAAVGDDGTSIARPYVNALEQELWQLRSARAATLRSAVEHRRLLREHSAVTARAQHDPLTGLLNRRAVDLRLDDVVGSARMQPCTVALLDLDGFKLVNDRHSHDFGDQVLRDLAGCLRDSFRDGDLVARYGGDEFVVVLPRSDLAAAATVVDRARKAVAALPPDIGRGVTVSAGLAAVGPGMTPAGVLAVADQAMYAAKRSGGDTVVAGTPSPEEGADDPLRLPEDPGPASPEVPRPGGAGSTCSLAEGGPVCTCAADAPSLPDADVARRALDMSTWNETAGPADRRHVEDGFDRLIACLDARPVVQATVLAYAVFSRFEPDEEMESAANIAAIDRLLAKYALLAEQHDNPRWRGESLVLRVLRSVTANDGADVLPDLAAGFATLVEGAHRPGPRPPTWAGGVIRSLIIAGRILLEMAMFELADEVLGQADAMVDRTTPASDLRAYGEVRIRLDLLWGLRLERAGHTAAAATRFAGAAAAAAATRPLLTGPAYGDLTTRLDVYRTAAALADPGPDQLPELEKVTQYSGLIEKCMHAVTVARCLRAAGRPEEALGVLQERPPGDMPEHILVTLITSTLQREIADVQAELHGLTTDSARPYAAALEAELWGLHNTRIAGLRTLFDHHLLVTAHGSALAAAMQDPLTGLPNRVAFDGRVAQLTGSPHCVALADIDRFKTVNDTRSHAVGDRVLREIASWLRTALRADDLLARFGGDEFVVVLPDTPIDAAVALLRGAARTVAALPEAVGYGLTLSIGVTEIAPGSDPGAALAAADTAMYEAKRSGGGIVRAAER